MPIVAASVAGILVIAIMSAALVYSSYSASAASDRVAATLAETIAPDVAWRETSRIDHILNVHTDGKGAVIGLDNTVLAGNREAVNSSSARRYPIVYQTTPVGTLVASPMAPYTPPLPYWLLVVLAGFCIVAAYISAAFYSGRISAGLNRLTDYASSLGDTQATEFVGDVAFSEMFRLRVALSRASQRLRRKHEDMRRKVYRDPTTGLPNSALIIERLKAAGGMATFDAPAAYILLRFEPEGAISAASAPNTMRDLLRAAADRLNGEMNAHFADAKDKREAFAIGAVSEDHLGLFIAESGSRSDVSALLRALRRRLAAAFEIDGREVFVRVSGGVAMIPEDGATPDAILGRSELALKKMLNDDSMGFKFYTPRLDRIEEGRLRLEAELREGIENQEFRASFQPKVDFKTGRITGFEALARWRRPGGKIISPAAFIPLAEETGLIRDIGDHILIQACQKAKEWTDAGIDAGVAVNVSPMQFEQKRFVDKIIESMRLTGLPPTKLELEITESMAVSDPTRVSSVMEPLRAMGVSLAIDDFGTGHSNLSMLSQLPFSTFKIDRQFVSALDRGGQAPAIIEMILAMAETLGLSTVAEGVETPMQADFLLRRGCTLAQGYLYSPALPAEEVVGFATRWNSGESQDRKRAVGQI